MAAFAAAEDLASYLQVPSVDRYTAELLLDLASDAIRGEVLQTISEATTTETYDGVAASNAYADVIFLRQTPVTAVSGVVDDGVTLATTGYEWSARGWVRRTDGHGFSDAAGGITVTYTHGWASGSAELAIARGIALQIAARAYVNPGQVDRVTVGSVSRDFARTSPRPGRLELSEFEKRRLDPLRR